MAFKMMGPSGFKHEGKHPGSDGHTEHVKKLKPKKALKPKKVLVKTETVKNKPK